MSEISRGIRRARREPRSGWGVKRLRWHAGPQWRPRGRPGAAARAAGRSRRLCRRGPGARVGSGSGRAGDRIGEILDQLPGLDMTDLRLAQRQFAEWDRPARHHPIDLEFQ